MFSLYSMLPKHVQKISNLDKLLPNLFKIHTRKKLTFLIPNFRRLASRKLLCKYRNPQYKLRHLVREQNSQIGVFWSCYYGHGFTNNSQKKNEKNSDTVQPELHYYDFQKRKQGQKCPWRHKPHRFSVNNQPCVTMVVGFYAWF